MASYRARAVAIHRLIVNLRGQMEQYVDGSPADKAVLISMAVEATNKLLYCFMLSQDMFDSIDRQLNDHLNVTPEPQAISALYLRALDVVRQLEQHASAWVAKYS